jgi:hypothetical protein
MPSHSELILDVDHRYWLGEKEVPGVSALLEWKFPTKHRWPRGAADRGHMVHRAIALDNQGVLDESTVAPVIKGYLDAERKFNADFKVRVLHVEYTVFEPHLWYAGTADGLIEWGRGTRPCVVDYKSGIKTNNHWLQNAAYVRGTPKELMPWRDLDGLVVYLKPDGTYKLDWYEGLKLIEAVRLWEVIPREYAHRNDDKLWG